MGGSTVERTLEPDDEEEDVVPESVVDERVAKYEGFIEAVLRKELQASLDDFRSKYELLEQCRELRRNIGLLIEGDVKELETMVELGCQFFVRAKVPDTSRIFVDVGLGFQLEMPLAEAAEFLEQKEALILSQLETKKNRTAKIKADIHDALHILDLMTQVKSGKTPWLDACDPSLIESFRDNQ